MRGLKGKVKSLLDQGMGVGDIATELDLPDSDILRVCEHLAIEQESEGKEVALSTDGASVVLDESGRILYMSPNEQLAMLRFRNQDDDPLQQELKVSAGYALLEMQRRLSSKRLSVSELTSVASSLANLQNAFVNKSGLSVNIANVTGEGSMVDAFRSKLRN